MNFKLGALAFIAANLLILSACSDDKSSSANSLPDEVANLSACTSVKRGARSKDGTLIRRESWA